MSLELTILAKIVQIVDDGSVFFSRFYGHSVGPFRQSSAVVPTCWPVRFCRDQVVTTGVISREEDEFWGTSCNTTRDIQPFSGDQQA